MESPYTTDTLAHFVGRRTPLDHDANSKVLETILRRRCVSHSPHTPEGSATRYVVDLSKSLEAGELIVPTVTCFADIPEGSLAWHIDKYGYFGVGFERKSLVHAGARPVTYVPMFKRTWPGLHGVDLLRDIQAGYTGFREHYKARVTEPRGPGRSIGAVPKTEEEILRHMKALFEKDFLAFIKPFDSELPLEHPNNFYMEREWRKYGYLKFEKSDVQCVWVATGYAARFASQFPELASRITELPPRGAT